MPGPDAPARTNRWSPRKFARARLEGKTLAEAAIIAGSRSKPQYAATQGMRWERHPSVLALYAEAEPDLLAAWAHGSSWMRRVLAGEVEATNMDRIACIGHVGKALGRFIERKEVTVNLGRVVCRDLTARDVAHELLGATPTTPALPEATGTPACEVLDVQATVSTPAPLPDEGA